MEEISAEFEVRSIQEKDICLRHRKKGLIVFVQTEEYRYDRKIVSKIRGLEKNDIAEITLKSVNDSNTIWIIESIGNIRSANH